MASYVLLMNLTDQGAKNVQEIAGTVDENIEVLERKHGVRVISGARLGQVHWTIGPYDVVAIVDVDDDEHGAADEKVAAFTLDLGRQGNVRTTTMRAYDREEMAGILQRLDEDQERASD